MGANPLLSTTDYADECPAGGWKQDINQINLPILWRTALPILWRTAFQAEVWW